VSEADREEELEDSEEIWSASKLEIVQQCGRKYRLRYVDKIPETKGAALKFGSVVHKCIETMHKDKMWDITDVQMMWADSWNPVSRTIDWTKETLGARGYKDRGIKMLEQYQKSHSDDFVVSNEIRFKTPSDGRLPGLRGIIDKIQEIDSGVYGVVDFKTSKHPPDPVVLRRDLQLTTYYRATKQLGYNINYFAIHHLLSGEVYWTWRDDSDLNWLEESLTDTMRRVEGKLFARNIGFACKWCSYKDICLGWEQPKLS
jgi:ATP-dependent helicase/DNAse subunit B